MTTEYQCILMDPPWNEQGGGKIKRGADRHYPLIKGKDQIVRTIITADVWNPAPNCHLWMWVTNNYLKDGLFIMEALGFRYVTNAVWAKDRFGLGQYLRGQHEILLFGVKGRLKSLTRSESSLIEAPRGRHSKKPEESYRKIEAISPGPRLEMFARYARPGWDSWGNEIVEKSPPNIIPAGSDEGPYVPEFGLSMDYDVLIPCEGQDTV